MNIIVRPHGSDMYCCRPDTTLERESGDFYSPERVREIWWTPVAFVRISKAGKCIGTRFVERYYESVGYGMLMYCRAGEFSSCADHTSVLPLQLHRPEVMTEDKPCIFSVDITHTGNADDLEQYHAVIHDGTRAILEESICGASQLTSLRIGDIVAVELEDMKPLASIKDGETAIKGTFCGNEVFNFRIIF